MKRKLQVLTAVLVAAGCITAVAAAASSPSVTTGAVTGRTQTTAVLHGSVNPNGRATTYVFQYGLTTSYGVSTASHSAGSKSAAVAARGTAAKLIPGTVYHYRLVAVSRSGISVGRDRAFTTVGPPPPAVATGPATAVSSTAATVTGVINPNRAATTYEFQYGLTTAYTNQTIATTLPKGSVPVSVASVLSGLTPGTVFHYRIVALHGNTPPQPGADGSFMTLPLHRPVPQIHARTKPLRDANKPFVFTTTGSVHGPSWIPAIYDCRGNVSIRYFRGSRRIGSTLVPLGPDCKFSGQTVFNKLPGNGPGPVAITVVAHYLGNFYLTPHKTSGQTITFG